MSASKQRRLNYLHVGSNTHSQLQLIIKSDTTSDQPLTLLYNTTCVCGFLWFRIFFFHFFFHNFFPSLSVSSKPFWVPSSQNISAVYLTIITLTQTHTPRRQVKCHDKNMENQKDHSEHRQHVS